MSQQRVFCLSGLAQPLKIAIVTVLEVIQKSAEFLAKKGIESPRLQAELLLAHVLKMPRMQLYLNFERKLSESELNIAREFIKRRAQHEPVQYIIGSASFCGLELVVNRHVLVPRPETELLAEKAWEFLLGCAGAKVTALDFGTGSGCIAIALAVHCQRASIWAIDASKDALEVARLNAQRHGVIERINFVHGTSLRALPAELSFDLIVSNPPYIPCAQIGQLPPEVRDYEPTQALDGGVDGLDYFRMFAAEASRVLKQGGQLMLEFGDEQDQAVCRIFQEHNWVVAKVERDYNQKPRFIVLRRG